MRIVSPTPRIQATVMFYLLLGALFLLSAPVAHAQTRVNDRDVEALMRNLSQDSKNFRQRFDSAIQKSTIRKTSQEKDAKKLVATFVRQTDDMLKRFKKDRNGAARFTAVMNTAKQVDAIVNSVSLGTRAIDQWQKVRQEVHQLAVAYNIPEDFPARSPNTAAGAYDTPSAAVAMPETYRPADTWLRISVFADVPIAGADIAVFDVYGKRIFEKKAATNNRGVYPAPISHLPRNFRVTATSDGARLRNSALHSMGRFTLSADVRDFDPASGIAYINPATTLATHLADRLPGHDLAAAQVLVRHFLVLPPHSSLGAAMRQGRYYQSPYFSETIFLTQAQRNGGLDRFLNDLTPQVLKPAFSPQSFSSARTNPVASVAKFVGVGLANGVLSWLGGQGIGWVLSSGDKPEPGATQKDIEQLQDKLADLQSSVDNLSTQLTTLSDDIKAEMTEAKYTQYVVPALALSTQVDAVEENLAYYAQDCPPVPDDANGASRSQKPEEFCNREREKIAADLNYVPIEASFGTFSKFMLPNGLAGQTGMIRLYSQSLAARVRFFRPADSTRMQNMFDYWYSVQIQAANLKVENLHFRGKQDTPGGRDQLQSFLGYANLNPPKAGTLQNTLGEEEKLTYPAVPANTVVNTRDGTMWLMGYPTRANTYNTIVNCGAPPTGVIWNYPVTEPVEMHKLKWLSPTLSQARALVEGWTGANANQWITNNSQALAPNTPTSVGFFDLLQRYTRSCVNGPLLYYTPTVWTREFTRILTDGPYSYKVYNTLDINDGKIKELHAGDSGTGNVAWILLARQPDKGEQYYWYPGQ